MTKQNFRLSSVAVVLGLMVNSCGSDDGPSAKIEGKWDYVKTITQVDNQQETSVAYPGDEPGCMQDYQEFVADNSFRDVAYFQNQDDECQEFVEGGNWQKTGDQLTIERDGDQPETFTITKLTGSALQYRSVTQTGGITFSATFVFRRID